MRPLLFFTAYFMVWLSTGVSHLAGADYDLSAASYLGGASTVDSVRAAVIQSNGTVVLAANIGSVRPGGLTPTVLGAATVDSGGALVRLASDGKTVLGVTLVGAMVTDLACDANDRLYVGLGTAGLIALDAGAATVRWSKAPSNTVLRLDVGATGTCAALATSTADAGTAAPGAGTIWVYDADGTQLGSFPGYRNTLDLAVDDTTDTVALIGWRQTSIASAGGPVQISFMRGYDFSGTVKWTGYDWSADVDSPNYLNKIKNNMADSRGCRISMGRDGKLYGLFEVAGGNHLFRYSPMNITTGVTIAGGDAWNSFSNTKSEHKTFVARYEPATGAYLRGVQFCARLSVNGTGKGNAANPHGSEVCADEQGRVYFGGVSAFGLPIPPQFTPAAGQAAFAPVALGDYYGGAFLVVMNPDLTKRLYCTALTNTAAITRAIAAREVAGRTVIAFGGETGGATYTLDPIQATSGAAKDGWFAVSSSGISTVSNPYITSPLAAAAVVGAPFSYTIAGNGASPISFSASGLPAWLSRTDAILSGTPIASGSHSVTIQVSDAVGNDSRTLVITVAAAAGGGSGVGGESESGSSGGGCGAGGAAGGLGLLLVLGLSFRRRYMVAAAPSNAG